MSLDYKKEGDTHMFVLHMEIQTKDDKVAQQLNKEMQIFHGKKLSLVQRGEYL